MANNITSLVKDVTYFYIKHFYEQELLQNKVNKLSEIRLQELINRLYTEKSTDLKKYIRETLKENLKEEYSSFTVENILLEMFSDPEYSKHRVYLEILEYQKTM
jgi:hypothetical protein